jgi:CTP synthase (UTP-ammonia lyase)
MSRPRIILVGERDPAKPAHRGIEAAFDLYRQQSRCDLQQEWVSTATITPDSIDFLLRDATGLWCTPGSPYESTAGALLAIQRARTAKIAFLGTCGGFQHALMEFARNVLRHPAEHEELSPAAKEPLIVKLSCSLLGTQGRILVTAPDLFADVLRAGESWEEFNCNYGINRDLAAIFQGSDLVFVAHDELHQPRAFRLRQHPFFIGTLFQPERKSLAGSLHPVVQAFFRAAAAGGG